MAKKTDPRPRHQQIAAEIRASIMDGELSPGSRLPTTQQLMAKYQVTNQTVQRTLGVLKDEGFLVGRSGVGVYVREQAPLAIAPAAYMNPPVQGAPYAWITQAANRGQKGKIKLLDVAELVPPSAVAQTFKLSEGATAVVRKQLLFLDDEPSELALIYFPSEIAARTALAKNRPIPGGSARVLTELGYIPQAWSDQLSVRLPTTYELQMLELPDDIPVLRTFRTVYGGDNRPIEIQILIKGGHRYEVEYHQQIPSV